MSEQKESFCLCCGASRGENIHLTPEVRDVAVWPHLWFRFPELLMPSFQCTCQVPLDPLAGPFHHREYMTLLPCPVQLIATERHDKTWPWSCRSHRGSESGSFPSPSLSLCYSLSPLLSKCKIRLTEHKHLLLESEAAPFGAEIKLCCLHATMNNEAITSDRRATSLRTIHTSNPIGCCTCAKSLQKCIDLAHALFLCAEDSLGAN